ncbi:MAG: transport system permease [Xanthobacteraceae bacterium]|jgi:iron complex transport system permease protein|nr:transport system permease [Xanthobacteraceae bacterium]
MSGLVRTFHPLPARTRRLAMPLLLGLPPLLAAVLTVFGALELLDPHLWWKAALAPNAVNANEMLFHYAFLPRLAVGLLAGAALGLSGTLFQQILRNPLAEPTTLGSAAGASLALTVATLFAPGLLDGWSELTALAGAGVATLAVFMVAGRRRLSPVALILAGLVVTLIAGSASALLVLMKRDYLTELFIWQSGSLVQNDWGPTLRLVPWLIAGGALAALMVRPLAVLDLGDDTVRSLGLPPTPIRLAGLAIAVALGAVVVAAVGVIGFVGIAAPALAGRAGARTLKARMLLALPIGGCLVWFADQTVQRLGFIEEIPAGTATALIGAPVLLLLLPRLRLAAPGAAVTVGVPDRTLGPRTLAMPLIALALLIVVAVSFGRHEGGWEWATGGNLAELLPLRLPRVAVALGAGVMFGMAGAGLQRISGNAMAAPEVLGVSAGAALGVMALMLLTPELGRLPILVAACLGAAAALLVLVAVGRGEGAGSERLLLAGVAVTTAASALEALVLASGDPRLDFLLSWMSGSTYRATGADALVSLAGMAATLVLLPLAARWLEILPLGPMVARALGIDTAGSRLAIIGLIAIPTAIATVAMGPLSFVGLLGPHMARMLGFRRALPHLFASGLLGGIVLVAADWCGRMLIYPWQLPAGLIAGFVGGPYFLWLMSRAR